MAAISSEPTFVLLSDDPGIQGYIERFGAAIAERPAAFATALEKLGEAATAATVNLTAENDGALHLAVTEEDLITTYFARRFDRYIEYDPDTERGLNEDADFQALLTKHLATSNSLAKTGKMTTVHTGAPDAEAKRNAVRRASLAYFISRTALWQARQPSDRLPSAG